MPTDDQPDAVPDHEPTSSLPLRLDPGVVPEHYDLLVDVDLDSGDVAGAVDITLQLDRALDELRLHAVDLDVTAASVRTSAGVHRAAVTPHPADEQIVVRADVAVGPGPVVLHLEWSGALSDQLVGLYRSTYSGDDGADVPIAVTQFESTHARRAFPCLDEPTAKATFSIAVVADADHLVVSNAAERRRTPLGDGRVRVDFERTVPMSTYLVAFVIGPLEVTELPAATRRRSRIPLRIIHRPGQRHLTAFALEVAVAAVDFLEAYYDSPCPGDSLDLVAVPDFAFGAMENLGCVTFREVLLLVDPDDATQSDLQRVADVIAHELAHMWFGDLVTMRWWNGLWLNEAFATFMEVTASADFRPDWDCWTGFGLLRTAAFDTDALHSTRPIEYPVHSPADAEGMFDVITYEKGASVVRMLEQYLGPDRFRDGIRAYLRQHRFGNTETTDLWDAIEGATGEPVRRTMDAWVFRAGHPEVRAELTDTGVRLSQRRATATPLRTEAPPWPVPLVVTSSVRGVVRTDRILLEEPVEVDLGGAPDWVQPNTGGDGFFRSRLDPTVAVRIADAERPALERFVLLDDAWAGLLAGHTTPDELLDLVGRIAPNTTDPAIWRRAAAALDDLVRLVGAEDVERVASFARRTATDRLGRIDADGVPAGQAGERTRTVRSVAFALAGGTGADDTVRSRARELFAAAAGDGELVEPALRSAATDVVARTASSEEHRELERRWRDAPNPQEQLRHLHHLADTPLVADLQRTIALALDEVRPQDRPYLLRRALRHPTLASVAWSGVSDHWDRIVESCSAGSLARMLEGVTACTDRALAGRIESFLSTAGPAASGRTVEQHVERMWVSVTVAERLRAR